jgi:hypothetical protein
VEEQLENRKILICKAAAEGSEAVAARKIA